MRRETCGFSVVAEDKVVMFSAAQTRAGGSPIATVERTGINSPQGLAFDDNGNLWVAAHDDDAVVRIDAGPPRRVRHRGRPGDHGAVAAAGRRHAAAADQPGVRRGGQTCG
jgi:sugar lactone lactonase YvrE